MIAVPIMARDEEGLKRALEEAVSSPEGPPDILEIRLDHLSDPSEADLSGLVRDCRLPLIFTNRRAEEGGEFTGGDSQRVKALLHAARALPDWIDIELLTQEGVRQELIGEAKGLGIKVIVSWHDFSSTPSVQELEGILEQMAETGADAAKIVTMAKRPEDFENLVPLFSKARRLGIGIISFCMGEAGVYSRACAPFLGSLLTFAAPDGGPGSAPGQLPFSRLKRIMKELGWRDRR